MAKNEEKLLKISDEQEKESFEKFKGCYDEMIQIAEYQTFLKGFKLGAGFFIKCIKKTPTYSMNEI